MPNAALQVMTFFNGLGLRCPKDKGEADFLQDVTLPADQKAYRADKNSIFLTPLVRTVSITCSSAGSSCTGSLLSRAVILDMCVPAYCCLRWVAGCTWQHRQINIISTAVNP